MTPAERPAARPAGHRRADAGVPDDQGPGDGRLVINYEQKKRIKPFTPKKPEADGTWRMSQADVDRVQEFRKCIECYLCQDVCHVLRDHHLHEEFVGPRFLVHAAALEMHPLDTADRTADLKKVHGIGYCNITKCCTKVCPEGHHDHGQRDHPAQGAGGRRVLRPDQEADPAGGAEADLVDPEGSAVPGLCRRRTGRHAHDHGKDDHMRDPLRHPPVRPPEQPRRPPPTAPATAGTRSPGRTGRVHRRGDHRHRLRQQRRGLIPHRHPGSSIPATTSSRKPPCSTPTPTAPRTAFPTRSPRRSTTAAT